MRRLLSLGMGLALVPSCAEPPARTTGETVVVPAPLSAREPSAPPCVDPERDARERESERARGRGSPGEYFSQWTAETIDLDGDGKLDLLVADGGRCGSGGCNPWYVYVWRGSCAVYVGAVSGQGLEPLQASHHGLVDVRSESHAGMCPFTQLDHAFDGREYQLRRSRWCDCPKATEENTDPPFDAGCKPWEPR